MKALHKDEKDEANARFHRCGAGHGEGAGNVHPSGRLTETPSVELFIWAEEAARAALAKAKGE